MWPSGYLREIDMGWGLVAWGLCNIAVALFVCLPVSLFLPACLSVYACLCLCVFVCVVCLSACLSMCLYLLVCLAFSLSLALFLSMCFSLGSVFSDMGVPEVFTLMPTSVVTGALAALAPQGSIRVHAGLLGCRDRYYPENQRCCADEMSCSRQWAWAEHCTFRGHFMIPVLESLQKTRRHWVKPESVTCVFHCCRSFWCVRGYAGSNVPSE